MEADHGLLVLGRLKKISQRRAVFRVNHLGLEEMRRLWHARGLIHALLRLASSGRGWHLEPAFRMANGWDAAGRNARNNDEWGYSRHLGQTSALMDFVTFGEEWFVRPPRRDVRPDNRVECQSFTKSRYFNRLFYPDRPDLPPAKCPVLGME